MPSHFSVSSGLAIVVIQASAVVQCVDPAIPYMKRLSNAKIIALYEPPATSMKPKTTKVTPRNPTEIESKFAAPIL